MSLRIIVSYDDTHNDQDALALGRILGDAGASIALAYVRHHADVRRTSEVLAEREAEELLARGAAQLGLPDAARHVVMNPSTPNGLRDLAERERADLVVFGSDYRTPAGSVRPGTSARRLLEGGPVAIAIAAAGLRARHATRFGPIGVLDEAGDDAAAETAASLARALGTTVADRADGPRELLAVGSRPEARDHHVLLSAVADYAIETAGCSVLAVPRRTPIRFTAPATTAAA